MTALIVLVVVLLGVTLIGHGLWVLAALLIRAMFGMHEADTSLERPQQSPLATARRDLLGYKQTVNKLWELGRIEAAEREHLDALGREHGERLFPGSAATGPRVTGPNVAEPNVAGPTPAAAAEPAANEHAFGPRRERRELSGQELKSQYVGGVHPLDQPAPEPAVLGTLVATDGSQPGAMAPVAQRAMADVLRSFLVAHNIRWGELIAGLLIVFCSVGLVISLWSPLTETHRLLPSLVFLAGTLAIEAAGLYTLRRWRLRHTSRAVLTIATLLIPLSVVAGIAVAGTGEQAVRLGDPLALGFIAIGAVLYLGAIWLAGCALVRRHDAPWWLLAIATPTLALPLVPALVRTWGGSGGWIVAVASIVVSLAMLVSTGRRKSARSVHRGVRPIAARNQLMIAAVGAYALAVLVGFFTFHTEPTRATIAPLAISLSSILVALCGLGTVLRTSQVLWQRLTGTTLSALCGAAVFCLFPFAMDRPQWLVLWAVLTVAASVAVALRLQRPAMMALATMALGMMAVVLVPWWWNEAQRLEGAELWRMPFTAAGMLFAFGYGLALLASSALMARSGLTRTTLAKSPWSLPLTLTAAAWLSYAVLLAVISGCFGWLSSGEVPWRAAAAVIASAGVLSLFAAVIVKRNRLGAGALWYRLRFALLLTGQAGCLLAVAVALGWSMPERLFGSEVLLHGNGTWWWIAIAGGFALAWQIPRMISPKPFPGGLAIRGDWMTIDGIAGLAASAGIILCGVVAVVRIVGSYGDVDGRWLDERWMIFGSLSVPLVASLLSVAWLFLYGGPFGSQSVRGPAAERSGGLGALLLDSRILVVHAVITWASVRFFIDQPNQLVWVGSIAIAVTLLALLAAWRFAHGAGTRPSTSGISPQRLTTTSALASRSAGWGSAVAAVLGLTLLYHHLLQPLQDAAPVGVTSAVAVVTWIVIAILALAIASILTARSPLAMLAAALVPLAAVIAAATFTDNRWTWFETIGWVCLFAVVCQRGCEVLGVVRWLRGPSPQQHVSAWPLPVISLAALASAIACVFAAICFPLVWFEPAKAATIATPSFVALVAAALATARWIPNVRIRGVLSLSNIATILSAPMIALVMQRGWLLPQEGRLWLLATVTALAVVDAGVVIARDPSTVRWTSAMLKAGMVVLLGFSSAVWSTHAIAFSLIGYLALQAMAMWASHESTAARRLGRSPHAHAALRVGVGQAIWSLSILLSIPLLLSIGWPGREGSMLTATMLLGWLTMITLAARLGQPRLHRASDSVGEWVALSGCLLTMAAIVAMRIQSPVIAAVPDAMAIVAGGTVCAMLLLAATALLRVAQRMHVIAATSGILLAAVLLAIDAADRFAFPSRLAFSAVAAATVTALMTWMWPLRRSVRAALARLDLHWTNAEDQRATQEFSVVVLAVTAITLGLATVGAIESPLPIARYLLIASVLLCGWALAEVANRLQAMVLRTLSVLVFAAAILLTAVAAPQVAELRWLVTSMRMLVAGCCLVPIFGWLVPRTFGLNVEAWRQPLRTGAMVGLVVASLSLGAMFVLETIARTNQQIEALDQPLLLGIAALLAALCAAATWLAVRRADIDDRGVIPALSDSQRVGLIYLAQSLGFMVWLHLFLCRSPLAHLGLRPYWPYVVMALAFFSVAVVEWARRRGDRVLADTLRQSALLLPLIPAIGFWFTGAQWGWRFHGGKVDYAVALAVAGFYYLALSALWRSDRWPRLLAILLGNAAVWVTLLHLPGWEFLQHPQLWLIPPAVSVLVAVHLERERLQPSVLAAIRYAATLVIYIASTADMLIQQIGSTLWGPILLLTLALVGVAVGMLLQVRSFLYLGTLFVLIGVLSMVWHAQAAIDEVWPWWAFGITSGILILAGLTLIEKKKTQIRQLSQHLAGWEG